MDFNGLVGCRLLLGLPESKYLCSTLISAFGQGFGNEVDIGAGAVPVCNHPGFYIGFRREDNGAAQFFWIEAQDQYAAHPHSDRGQGNAGYAAFPADFIQTVGHSAVVGEKYGNIGTQPADRRYAFEQNLVAHRIFGSLLVSLPDFIMADFRCGHGHFAVALFCLPLLDIGSYLGHGLLRFTSLLRFTADVRAAETEMVGNQQHGSADNSKNNDFSGIGGHYVLNGKWSASIGTALDDQNDLRCNIMVTASYRVMAWC